MSKTNSNHFFKFLNIAFLVCFLSFLIFDIFIRPPKPEVGIISLVDAIFIIAMGLMITYFSAITGLAAWKMNSEDYYEWLLSNAFWGKSLHRSFLGNFSASYWRWQNRLLFIPIFLFGLLALVIGLISFFGNIQTCVMQQCIW